MSAHVPVTTIFRFAAFEVNLESGELRKHGVHIKLQGQPFQILAMLLERPGQVVTREEIKQRLWPEDTFVDFDHSMNTAIRRLREALSDSADTPRYIETLPRKGYRFLGEVNAGATPSDSVAAPKSELELPKEIAKVGGRRERIAAAAAVAVLLLMLLIGGVMWFWMPRIDSLAVLPFVTEGTDPNLQVFGDGIVARVVDDLSSVERLRVASLNSVLRFKNTAKKPAEIASELKVRGIVVGSIRRNGDNLEVELEMMDTKEDRHLWGKTYLVKEAEIATLEGSIVRDITERLYLKLSPQVQEQLKRSRTTSAAYQAFLRGDAVMNRRDNANFRSALMYFQRAVDADPNFALGYIGLGKAYGLLGAYGGMPAAEAARLGEASFDRALELDPNLAEAHGYKAVSLMTIHRNFPAAEKELKKALELNPNSAATYHAVAELQTRTGHPSEALVAAQRAEQLDPYWGGYFSLKTWALYYLGRNEEALTLALARSDARSNHLGMAEFYINAGRKHEAMGELANFELAKMQVPDAICTYARELARLGDASRAREALKRGLELQEKLGGTSSRGCAQYSVARTYAVLGDREQMYESLEASEKALEPSLGYIVVEPLFHQFRREARFQEVVKLATTSR